jgi:uncharacterized membrane protein YcgQ (UPF0703/DUF1980 family)
MLIFTNSPAAHGAVVRPGRLEAAAAPTELAVLIAAFKVHIYMREHHWVHDYIRNSYNMMFDAAIASANKYIIHPTYLQTKATSTQIHKHTCIDIYTCIHSIHTYITTSTYPVLLLALPQYSISSRSCGSGAASRGTAPGSVDMADIMGM